MENKNARWGWLQWENGCKQSAEENKNQSIKSYLIITATSNMTRKKTRNQERNAVRQALFCVYNVFKRRSQTESLQLMCTFWFSLNEKYNKIQCNREQEQKPAWSSHVTAVVHRMRCATLRRISNRQQKKFHATFNARSYVCVCLNRSCLFFLHSLPFFYDSFARLLSLVLLPAERTFQNRATILNASIMCRVIIIDVRIYLLKKSFGSKTK